MAGLGTYAYEKKGYKRVATVAEDYSFPYTQVFGSWPSSARRWSRAVEVVGADRQQGFLLVIAAIPADVDAVYVALGGADGVNFLTQYQQAGGTAPLIGGSITVDQTVLARRARKKKYVIGTPSAGPIADTWDNPNWKAFVAAYKTAFPTASRARRCSRTATTSTPRPSSSLSTRSTATSPTTAQAPRDPGEPHFRYADRTGQARRQSQCHRQHLRDGSGRGRRRQPPHKVVEVKEGVTQTLGQPAEEFMKLGVVGRDNPACP